MRRLSGGSRSRVSRAVMASLAAAVLSTPAALAQVGINANDMAERFAGEAARQDAAAKAMADAAAARAERARKTAERRRAEEAEMLARAHAEAEQRNAAIEGEDRARAEAGLKAEKDRLRVGENAAAVLPVEDVQARTAEMERMGRERQAELDRISEKIRRVQGMRARGGGPSMPRGQDPIESASGRGEGTDIAQSEPARVPQSLELNGSGGGRATVLLVMQPGDRGIRRFNKSADPILCIADRCYVSGGAQADARPLSRARAFGMGNTLGARAGACSNRLTCVFRNVALPASTAFVQPVDLRLVSHDRREPREARIDGSCRMGQRGLACAAAVRAANYALWVVPEVVAAQAGPVALEAALKTGLSAISTQAQLR